MSESRPRNVSINWRDADGNHRGFTITAGQAHVGHLVELILGNLGTDIEINRGAHEKRLRTIRMSDEPQNSGPLRRYLAIVQDERGYPAPTAALDEAPPGGPEAPCVVSVVKAEEHEAEVERLRGKIERLEHDLAPSKDDLPLELRNSQQEP